ncbi:MAG: ribosomal protein S12 methylthiotransferase [Myxococcota bacterium]|jgi:ribosomal protein S12 methylthiotransferase
MSGKRLYFQTLGCPKNRVDSEVMLGALARDGYELVADRADADVMVVNTCSFIEASKVESIDAIMDLVGEKDSDQQKRVVVAGCFAQRYSDAIVDEIPEVDVIVGTGEYHRITELLDAPVDESGPTVAVGRPYYVHNTDTPRMITTLDGSGRSHMAYLKIAEGCSQRCTFCIIPKLRGKQRSRGIPDLVAEARQLAGVGVRELNLIAQDLTHYGSDLKDGTELHSLLPALGEVNGVDWIRLLYCYPHNVTDELVEVIATNPKVLPYIDIPLQHIDNALLMGMQRRTTEQVTTDLLRRLRSAVPEIVVRTTFIVGFPGETEQHFDNLMEFVAEQRFDHVGVFTYSSEEGTKAARMEDDVPAELKLERQQRLMAMQREISAQRLELMVGREVDVLVEGVSEETDLLLQGRYWGQAPEVDGVTYISEGYAEPGSIVRARVVQTGDYDLVTRLV